jgi:3-oxoacyl-[acyl-carrier-protein] synthase II
MIKRHRVVVTGMGVLAPNGIGLEAFWDSLLAGRSGIGPITLFDASHLQTKIGGEVKNFDPGDFIEPDLKPRRMARHTQFAYAAAMMALRDSGLEINERDLPSPTPVVVGVSTSAMDIIERSISDFDRRGSHSMSPSAISALKPQAPANIIADRIGTRAHAATVSTACPSGLDALANAANSIRSGEADLAIAGGADAPLTPHTMAAFIASGLTAPQNGNGERASKPFDLERESGVLAEGSGMFVLENLDRAEARGARIYLEISGYGAQRDPNPADHGAGLRESMKMAIANAQITKDQIDYICAYGPGDPTLDAAEIRFIKDVFGASAYSIPVSSIKGVTGNPLAAAGPLQVVACALAIRDQLIPPTANFRNADPDCDLDIVPFRSRRATINHALLNVRGLGGSASSLVMSRP